MQVAGGELDVLVGSDGEEAADVAEDQQLVGGVVVAEVEGCVLAADNGGGGVFAEGAVAAFTVAESEGEAIVGSRRQADIEIFLGADGNAFLMRLDCSLATRQRM